jgi:exopolysaccharide production protein ExoQ
VTTNTTLDKLILGLLTIGVSTALLSFLFSSDTEDPIVGNPAYQHALMAIYGIAAIYALAHFRSVFEMIRRSTPLALLLTLALISCAWAEHPAMVFRRASFMLGCTLVGVLLAVRFTASERLVFLRFLLRFLSIASLVCVLLFPAHGIGYLKSNDNITHHEWNGVFVAKNRLGAVVGLSALIDGYSQQHLWQTGFWYSLYILLLVKSDSMTPVAALIVTYIIITSYHWLADRRRWSDKSVAIAFSIFFLPILFIGLYTGIFQTALGKGDSLSGRTTIWRLSAPLLLNHPLLGFGYDGLFRGASDEFYAISSQMNWPVPAAHNGYLEIALDLGLVGAVLALWFLTQSVAAVLRQSRIDDSREASFPLALLLYFIISNMAEGTILSSTIMWTIFVATVLDIMPSQSRISYVAGSPGEAVDLMSDSAPLAG